MAFVDASANTIIIQIGPIIVCISIAIDLICQVGAVD